MIEELVIASSMNDIDRARQFVEECLLPLNISRKERSNVMFCLVEAVVNAVNHGNGGDPSKKVRITFRADDAKVTVSVSDEGPGFDPEKIPDPTAPEEISRPTGRGIFFMRQMMSALSFDFSPAGTTVTMTKNYNGKH